MYIPLGGNIDFRLLYPFSKQVTCLSVSMDGTKLVSGSHDCTVKIWDIFSGQCVRSLSHKGNDSTVIRKQV